LAVDKKGINFALAIRGRVAKDIDRDATGDSSKARELGALRKQSTVVNTEKGSDNYRESAENKAVGATGIIRKNKDKQRRV